MTSATECGICGCDRYEGGEDRPDHSVPHWACDDCAQGKCEGCRRLTSHARRSVSTRTGEEYTWFACRPCFASGGAPGGMS